jgi:hypothetical protein
MKKTDLIETLELLLDTLKAVEPKPKPSVPRRRGRKPRPLTDEEISAGFAKIRRELALP